MLVPYCACYIHTPRLVQLGGSIGWEARTYISLPTAQCGVDWVGMCTAHSYIPQKSYLYNTGHQRLVLFAIGHYCLLPSI